MKVGIVGHCIQAIVAANDVADAICARYPELLRVKTPVGFSILPVEDAFYDRVVQGRSPQAVAGEFMLLSEGFHDALRDLSHAGPLAYIETDYFGGQGGQGAAVYMHGDVIMKPMWSERGPIKRALRKIGLPSSIFCNRLKKLGLASYRSNDDLVDAAMRR